MTSHSQAQSQALQPLVGSASPANDEAPRVLVVDDEPAIALVFRRILNPCGYTVETCLTASEALAAVQAHPVDVIISDIAMPGMNGLELLKAVRELDLDLPVVLTTGGPSIESAVGAVDLGALRYLLKPVSAQDLMTAVEQALVARRQAKERREAQVLLSEVRKEERERDELAVRFDAALEKLWMAHQPIVSWNEKNVAAYEALVRSTEPSMGNPAVLFEAAEQLDRVFDLGRIIRVRAAETAKQLPEGVLLFVNLHPLDLTDDQLFAADTPLSAIAPRVVLEVTERAALEGIKDLGVRLEALRRLGFRLAIDDLGAGYASLSTFAQLQPEVAKIDMSLVRGVEQGTTKATVIRSILELCRRLGVLVVTEGVETQPERAALTDIGCDLLQGYLFAKPARGLPEPSF